MRSSIRFQIATAVLSLPMLAAVSAGRSAGGTPPPAPAPPDLATATLVDLSHPFDDRTLYWPTSTSSFALERLAYGPTPLGFFYASNAFCAPEHGGTHLDAPVHFGEGRRTTDQIPVRQLVAAAVVIDVSTQAATDPDYRLTRADLLAWEARHGTVPEGAAVLLRTGWGGRWPDRKRYFGDDTPGSAANLHFPSFGAEAAALLLDGRRAGILGVDTPSIDHGPSLDFPVHRLAAAANVPALENLARLEELPPIGAWIVALPMKIAGGSGGPVRAIALVAK
jgi:kynurenine formamidase